MEKKLAIRKAQPRREELEKISDRIGQRFGVFQKTHPHLSGAVFLDTSLGLGSPVVRLRMWFPHNETLHASRQCAPTHTVGAVLWPLKANEMRLLGEAVAAVMDDDMVLENISTTSEDIVAYSFLPARCAIVVE